MSVRLEIIGEGHVDRMLFYNWLSNEAVIGCKRHPGRWPKVRQNAWERRHC